MDKFKNKYRIPSARLQNWNYTWDGSYFITICTHNKKRHFGRIENGEMILSEIGKLAHQFWSEIPDHFPFVKLGAFVIMPDHMHGILIIDRGDVAQTLHCNVCAADPPYAANSASAAPIKKNEIMSNISPIAGSISTIIRSYKSVVSKHARKINEEFAWHERFHDRIIRDGDSFERVEAYIRNNPKKWKWG